MSENAFNRKLPSNNTTGFKGVDKNKRKFRARIQYQGKHIHLGYFKTAKEACDVYDKVALKLFGQFARTNKMMQQYEA
jgi:hypothetical protein